MSCGTTLSPLFSLLWEVAKLSKFHKFCIHKLSDGCSFDPFLLRFSIAHLFVSRQRTEMWTLESFTRLLFTFHRTEFLFCSSYKNLLCNCFYNPRCFFIFGSHRENEYPWGHQGGWLNLPFHFWNVWSSFPTQVLPPLEVWGAEGWEV